MEPEKRMSTILIVEDESMVRALETTVLKRAGYSVLDAADGVEGAVLFARHFSKIDLLVTDISLPGMRGPDLARFARSIRPDLPVLFASGSMMMEEIDPLQVISGALALPKPFTTEQLLEAVAATLAGAEMAANGTEAGDHGLLRSRLCS